MKLTNTQKDEHGLTSRIRDLIRADRGYSLIDSQTSDGVPSPVRENDSFKKLFDFKDTNISQNCRRIEFSDSHTKSKRKNKKKKEEQKDLSQADN